MTPIEIAQTVFLSSLGLIGAVSIAALCILFVRAADEAIMQAKFKREYCRYMDPEYWFFRKAEQCPNPDYISVSFENSASKEMLRLGIEKRDIRELLNDR